MYTLECFIKNNEKNHGSMEMHVYYSNETIFK